MRVITLKRLREFGRRHPDAVQALEKWYRIFRDADWAELSEVRRVFPHADAVRVASGNTVTVFNIRGNRYRLIAAIHYNRRRIYVLRMLTHAEYNKDFWKESL